MEWLLDTGILLRLVNRNDPHHGAVTSAVRTLHRRGDTLLTTPQNIVEFWNVSTRPAEARGGYGRSTVEAERCVRFFESLGTVIPELPVAYQEWRRLVATHSVTGKSVHDAKIAAMMIASNVAHILTLNPSDFARYPEITPVTPEEIVQRDSSGSF